MGRYMASRGWNVIIAGPIGIVPGIGYRHQLVIEFMGGKRREAKATKRQLGGDQ
jgi:hypothetical protein